MEIRPEILHWLLESDPAIRWQVMRDLAGETEKACGAEREKVAITGWGAKILAFQDPDGLWNKELYAGKWISTTYTLYLLKLLGLPYGHPQALAACRQLLAGGLYRGREIRFSRGQEKPDLGVSGIVLSLCCFFGLAEDSLHAVATELVERQRKTGNWLPDDSPSSESYTFETTLIILEGLLQYRERHPDKAAATTGAERKGQEFLLRHHLFLTGGRPRKMQWTSFAFPPYWFYDVLTALDYFRQFRETRDRRLQAGLDLLMAKRTREGTWKLPQRHPGKTYFDMEKVGSPSRWNTLRALRVLTWRESF